MTKSNFDSAKDRAELSDTMTDFAVRRKRERGRFWAKQPKPINKIVAQVMLKGGYGRQIAGNQLGTAWSEAAGQLLARDTRPGNIRRGSLQVTAKNSIVRQELTYVKEEILKKLQTAVPELDIRDLRVQIGKIS